MPVWSRLRVSNFTPWHNFVVDLNSNARVTWRFRPEDEPHRREQYTHTRFSVASRLWFCWGGGRAVFVTIPLCFVAFSCAISWPGTSIASSTVYIVFIYLLVVLAYLDHVSESCQLSLTLVACKYIFVPFFFGHYIFDGLQELCVLYFLFIVLFARRLAHVLLSVFWGCHPS